MIVNNNLQLVFKKPACANNVCTKLKPSCEVPIEACSDLFVLVWRAGYTPADRQTSWGVLHPY
jgi:hypothetical protein